MNPIITFPSEDVAIDGFDVILRRLPGFVFDVILSDGTHHEFITPAANFNDGLEYPMVRFVKANEDGSLGEIVIIDLSLIKEVRYL